MKTVTAIEEQKNNPRRVNIYLDDEFAFGLAKVTAAWLKVGQRVDEQKLQKLLFDEALEKAYQQCMLFLSFRARSEAEIRKNLAKHEFPPEVLDATLQRLREERLVNDAEFAQAWVANRSEFRPRSRRALAIELKRKGVAESAIRSATEAVNEEALAYLAAQKQVRRLSGLDWGTFREKLSGFLARRGFSYDIISPTVKRLWSESGGSAEHEDIEEQI